jgi:WhiB family transcriptional regulator, redox-sensing transcriptional regulator
MMHLNLPPLPAFFAEAACISADPDVFFPDKGEHSEEAQAICGACPVRVDCLEYAIAEDIHDGVWGGVTERKRQRMRARYHGRVRTSAA